MQYEMKKIFNMTSNILLFLFVTISPILIDVCEGEKDFTISVM